MSRIYFSAHHPHQVRRFSLNYHLYCWVSVTCITRINSICCWVVSFTVVVLITLCQVSVVGYCADHLIYFQGSLICSWSLLFFFFKCRHLLVWIFLCSQLNCQGNCMLAKHLPSDFHTTEWLELVFACHEPQQQTKHLAEEDQQGSPESVTLLYPVCILASHHCLA